MYIDKLHKLDNIVSIYDNTCHSKIKTKAVDLKPKTYIDSNKEINNKNLMFKIGDTVIISKYENIFCKRLHYILMKISFCD